MEFANAKWRRFVGIIIQCAFASGEVMVGAVAYFVRDWRWLHVALTGPAFLIIALVWLVNYHVIYILHYHYSIFTVILLKIIRISQYLRDGILLSIYEYAYFFC